MATSALPAPGRSDSLQLAAAVEWAGSSASGELVTLDERLALAGRLEGFDVSGPETWWDPGV